MFAMPIVVIESVTTCFEGPLKRAGHTRHHRRQVRIELRLPLYQLLLPLYGINYLCTMSIHTIHHIHHNFHHILEGPECTALVHDPRKVEIVTEGRLHVARHDVVAHTYVV